MARAKAKVDDPVSLEFGDGAYGWLTFYIGRDYGIHLVGGLGSIGQHMCGTESADGCRLELGRGTTDVLRRWRGRRVRVILEAVDSNVSGEAGAEGRGDEAGDCG